MGKVMRHTLGASLNIRDRKSGSAGMPRSEERFSRNAETDLVCRLLLEKKKTASNQPQRKYYDIRRTGSIHRSIVRNNICPYVQLLLLKVFLYVITSLQA